MNQKKTAWGQKAAAWDRQADDPHDKFTKLTDEVARLVSRHRRSGRVLDIGCGPGLLCRSLAQVGFDVYGTDISEDMVKAAITRLSGTVESPERRFRICADGEIPFGDVSFDVVTAIQVFPYIEAYTPYVRKIASLLAPGGLVLASNTNRLSLYVAGAVVGSLAAAPLRFGWSASARRLFAKPAVTASRTQSGGQVSRSTTLGGIVNLVRTGYWSGGYVDYRTAQQAYSASAFDALFAAEGFEVIDGMDWFHIRCLDRAPLHRGGIGGRLARRLAWYHVGVYQKPIHTQAGVTVCGGARMGGDHG